MSSAGFEQIAKLPLAGENDSEYNKSAQTDKKMTLPVDTQGVITYRFSTQYGLLGTARLDVARNTFHAKADSGLKSIGLGEIGGQLGQLTYLKKGEYHTNEEIIIDALRAHTVGSSDEPWIVRRLVAPKLLEGQHHPRVYRQESGPNPRALYGREYTDNVVAFENLQRRLEELFRVLEPDSTNDTAYGHSLRELIILACTEVELLWKQLLRANHYGGGTQPQRFSTNDYIKTKDALFLDGWEIALEDYPDYARITPFKGWDPSHPTQSLEFYDGYNAVKHSRDTEFRRATLKNAVTAVAAVYVLLGAQFGFKLGDFSSLEDGPGVFRWSKVPVFPLEEQYIPPARGKGWTAVGRQF